MSTGDVWGGETKTANALGWNDASSHRSGFVQGDGVRLNFLDWGGDKAPLVLIHGIANSPHIFDDLAPWLCRHFRILAYARRGHGQSDAPPGPYDSEALVSDLLHLLDDLGIERANLLGWSMGGDEITEFAGRYPERVDKLVYLDGGYDWSDSAFFKPFTDMLVVNSPRPQTLRSFDNLRAGIMRRGLAATLLGRRRSKRFFAMPSALRRMVRSIQSLRSKCSLRS